MSSDQIWTVTEDLGIGQNIFHSVIACSDGGYLATGTGIFQGRGSIFLMRLGENGEVVWRRFFQEYISQGGMEVVECQPGGFAVIGYTTSNNHDVLLLRTDEEGQTMWYRTYGGVSSYEQGMALVECQNDGFALAGFQRNYGSDDSDYFFVRTDEEGTQLWNRTYGGNAPDICYSLIETPSQEFYLAGSTESFGAGEEDAWIVKTYANGVEIWNYTLGGPMPDICYDIIESETEMYAFVGSTANSENMIPDGFAALIHGNGIVLWETTFGGILFDRGYVITKCQDGGYAIAGQTFDTSDRSNNLLLIRLTSEGEYQWMKSYGTDNDDEGRSIVQAPNGDFIIVGLTDGHIEDFYNSHSMALAIRVPDTSPEYIPTPEYGPPDFRLISTGGGLAILMLLGAYLMLIRSRRELRQSWVEPKRRVTKRALLTPWLIDELSPILRGKLPCMKCAELNPRSNLHCIKCTSHPHFCLFCGQVIGKDDPVLFCPKCKVLAHSNHMLEWLAKRNYCPSCGHRFNRRKYPIGKIGR
ncbi:MAG: hypothetical protein ACFE9D_12690 [Promethearchaeota archaeon]